MGDILKSSLLVPKALTAEPHDDWLFPHASEWVFPFVGAGSVIGSLVPANLRAFHLRPSCTAEAPGDLVALLEVTEQDLHQRLL